MVAVHGETCKCGLAPFDTCTTRCMNYHAPSTQRCRDSSTTYASYVSPASLLVSPVTSTSISRWKRAPLYLQFLLLNASPDLRCGPKDPAKAGLAAWRPLLGVHASQSADCHFELAEQAGCIQTTVWMPNRRYLEGFEGHSPAPPPSVRMQCNTLDAGRWFDRIFPPTVGTGRCMDIFSGTAHCAQVMQPPMPNSILSGRRDTPWQMRPARRRRRGMFRVARPLHSLSFTSSLYVVRTI